MFLPYQHTYLLSYFYLFFKDRILLCNQACLKLVLILLPQLLCLQCLGRPEAGVRSSEPEVVCCYELPCGCWELNQGPLLKQPVQLNHIYSPHPCLTAELMFIKTFFCYIPLTFFPFKNYFMCMNFYSDMFVCYMHIVSSKVGRGQWISGSGLQLWAPVSCHVLRVLPGASVVICRATFLVPLFFPDKQCCRTYSMYVFSLCSHRNVSSG